MNRSILPLLLAAVCATAEETAPQPTPAAVPAEAKPAAATAPANDVPAAGPASVAPAVHQVRGVRVARIAGAAPWEASVRLGAGYDSNALLENDPDRSRSATGVYSADANLAWRPVADDRAYLKLGVGAGHDRRPDLHNLDTSRFGLSAAGARQGETLTISGSLIGNRYWVDDTGAAAELRGGSLLGWLRRDAADLVGAEAAVVHYDALHDRPRAVPALSGLGTADDRSGVLAAGNYRHWWILDRQDRIEAGVRAGRFIAQTDVETYTLLQPFAALRLRPGAWELQARASLDWRAYAGSVASHDAERSTTLGALLSADRRLAQVRGLSAGAYAGFTTRDSSLPDRSYDRWQAGLRLSWTFAPEE